jgi:hypothetical protein
MSSRRSAVMQRKNPGARPGGNYGDGSGLHVEGRTRVLSETRKLDDVNRSIAEVLNESTAIPRLVFTF